MGIGPGRISPAAARWPLRREPEVAGPARATVERDLDRRRSISGGGDGDGGGGGGGGALRSRSRKRSGFWEVAAGLGMEARSVFFFFFDSREGGEETGTPLYFRFSSRAANRERALLHWAGRNSLLYLGEHFFSPSLLFFRFFILIS